MPLKLWLAMSLTMFLLFGFLFGILAAVGYYFELSGYLVVVLAVLMVFFQWLIGPKVIWWTTNMRLLEKREYPWIWDAVRQLCEKTKTPIPKLALVRSGVPNAFVFGRTPNTATLVITQGLLNSLTKDETKAVIAHEIGHIKHKDMVVMTVVSAIPVIAYFIARFMIFSPQREEKKGSAAALVGIAAFVIYFVSNLLTLALSRLREYYSDRFSGTNIKPSLLAAALAKITYGLSMSRERGADAARSFYICDPIAATSEISQFPSAYSDFKLSDSELHKAMEWERKNPLIRFSEIFRTHPLCWKRIQALKRMEK